MSWPPVTQLLICKASVNFIVLFKQRKRKTTDFVISDGSLAIWRFISAVFRSRILITKELFFSCVKRCFTTVFDEDNFKMASSSYRVAVGENRALYIFIFAGLWFLLFVKRTWQKNMI